MAMFLVCVSDRLTDIIAGTYETTSNVWCYRIDADSAADAVAPAISQWHGEVGDRAATSLTVSRLSPS